jgi:uncharacterized caspase-like protein
VEHHLGSFLGSIQVGKSDVVLAYFACHGVEFKGENYLLPCGFSKPKVQPQAQPSQSDEKPTLAQVELQLKLQYGRTAVKVT